MSRQIHLFANFNPGIGFHPARWRAQDPRAFLSLDHHVRSAQAVERAKFDACFLSDIVALEPNPPIKPWHAIETTVAAGAIAATTEHVGIITTLSTSFEQPYTLARRVAAIDHLSSGRAGWNIVTTYASAAAGNHGLDAFPDHAARYARAAEFVDVARGLWDSWEDDALVLNQETGEFVDPAKIHAIDHRGEHFAVSGPFQTPRSPQGQPVLIQAGTSTPGVEFGSRYADVIFVTDSIYEHAVQQHQHLKSRIRAHGRDPELVRIFPAVWPIVGETEAEALAIRTELDELRNWDFELYDTGGLLGVTLEHKDLDSPLGPLLVDRGVEHDAPTGCRANAWRFAKARTEGTLRDFILRGGTGHRQLVGSGEQIADDFEKWFTTGAADGFNLSFTHYPDQVERFGELVVPILQERGLFRREYEGTTLREHLGLPRPESVYARDAAEVVA